MKIDDAFDTDCAGEVHIDAENCPDCGKETPETGWDPTPTCGCCMALYAARKLVEYGVISPQEDDEEER